MAIRVLGPMEIADGSVQLRLPGRREQTILAILALRANRVVSAEALIDAVWEDGPPQTALTQIHGCISQLRKLLRKAGQPDAITRVGGGYQLSATSADLDLLAFNGYLADAEGVLDETARGLLTQALDLWRGDALAGLGGRRLRAAAGMLDEARLTAEERLLSLVLDAGEHTSALTKLRAIVTEHPLRERSHEMLAIALYAAGRQSEALAELRALRRRLVDELGIEPGPGVRELEQRILSHDPALKAPESSSAHRATGTETTGPAESRNGGAADTGNPLPRQLPRVLADFVGRDRELQSVVAHLAEAHPVAVRIVGIHGPGGIGKSTLAIRAAHEVAARFPDGQLYLDFDDPDTEDRAHILLGRALRALGVVPAAVPDDGVERAELYRSLLANRRLLLVLDGVRSEQQAAPLIPGSPTCAVILATRTRVGIDGVHWIEIGELDDGHSMELLRRILGPDRVDKEIDSSRDLVRYAGGLPLALRIAGARLASRPRWQVAELTRRMVNESRRLDEFSHRGRELRAGLASSYRSVPPEAKSMFRNLALIGGASMPYWLANVVAGSDVADPEAALDALIDAHLVQVRDAEPGGGASRLAFHNLVRTYSGELRAEEPPEVSQDTLARVLGVLLGLTGAAHRAEYGGDFHILRGDTERLPSPPGVREQVEEDPVEWMEGGRESLVRAVRLAAEAGMTEAAWELAMALTLLFERKGYHDEWKDTALIALEACERDGNRLGQAAMLLSLSQRSFHASESDTGAVRALAIFEELGHTHGMGLQLIEMAFAARKEGAQARRELAERAAGLVHDAGDVVAESSVLGLLAWTHLQDGEPDEARVLLARAGSLCRDVGYGRGVAQVELRRVQLELEHGSREEALEIARSVLEFTVGSGDLVGQAYAHRWLAAAHLAAGEIEAGRESLVRSLALAGALGLHGLHEQLEQLRDP